MHPAGLDAIHPSRVEPRQQRAVGGSYYVAIVGCCTLKGVLTAGGVAGPMGVTHYYSAPSLCLSLCADETLIQDCSHAPTHIARRLASLSEGRVPVRVTHAGDSARADIDQPKTAEAMLVTIYSLQRSLAFATTERKRDITLQIPL